MSTVDDLIKQQQSLDLVRLEVDGSKTAVNTIVDQQTGRGVSLVCPFPSLEVDLPVNYGKKADGALQRGTIHRIGVEDDPETGLPRLRLSVRAVETEEEIPIEIEGFEELQERPTRVASAQTDVDFLMESKAPSIPDLDRDYIGISSVSTVSNEPAWASSCEKLPTPEDILERARTRRKYRLSTAAAWFVICLLLGAGGYFVYSSEFMNMDKLRETISGDVQETPEFAFKMPVTNELEALIPAQNEEMPSEKVEEPAAEAVLEEIEETVEADATEVLDEKAEPAVEKDAKTASENTNEAIEVVKNEARVLLPTRWKPDYSTAYRVRNPHGVVVDVPGALVRREGWVESAKTHPMIRSVKAVQRETGARFIVYVNGDLPRFMTSPKASGVSLKLYHDQPIEIGDTEQVASAR